MGVALGAGVAEGVGSRAWRILLYRSSMELRAEARNRASDRVSGELVIRMRVPRSVVGRKEYCSPKNSHTAAAGT